MNGKPAVQALQELALGTPCSDGSHMRVVFYNQHIHDCLLLLAAVNLSSVSWLKIFFTVAFKMYFFK